MNNYIPLNKAVGPKLICDGEQALIPQKLGVDAMEFNFDGSACEHATCAGAPEMFIKVEEDGLYYFGVEADDTGSISIAGEEGWDTAQRQAESGNWYQVPESGLLQDGLVLHE